MSVSEFLVNFQRSQHVAYVAYVALQDPPVAGGTEGTVP
jgi:hypothetical protein